MKEKNNSEFVTQALEILGSLHIDSQHEVLLSYSLEQYYQQKIVEVVQLKTTKEKLSKKDDETQLKKTKEEKLDQALSEELNLLNHELALYKESLNNLKIQIASVEKELEMINPEAKEKILMLRRALLNLEENFKKEQKKLEEKKKDLMKVKQQKASIANLINLQKKQKKAISSERKLDASPLAHFLLPGKWLESYKDSLVTEISKLKEEIRTTEKIIRSFQKSESTKNMSTKKTSTVPRVDGIERKKSKVPQQNLPKDTKRTNVQNSKTQRSSLKAFSEFFKNIQIKGKTPLTPNATPAVKSSPTLQTKQGMILKK